MAPKSTTSAAGSSATPKSSGRSFNPGATLQYNLIATQTGLTTRGYASLTLSGTTMGGVPITMRGNFNIVGSVPGAVIGNSEVPFYFVTDTSNVQVTIGRQTQTIPESINIENPYFNPFGAPIVIGSNDGYIGIVATYNQGTILWLGSQVTGAARRHPKRQGSFRHHDPQRGRAGEPSRRHGSGLGQHVLHRHDAFVSERERELHRPVNHPGTSAFQPRTAPHTRRVSRGRAP